MPSLRRSGRTIPCRSTVSACRSGGARGLDQDHLDRVRLLCDRYEPDSFSEHLAWSSHGAEYLNDLLPLPYTDETLTLVL